MNAFCASVNFDAFIGLSSSPSQGRLAENFSFKRSSFQGAEQELSDWSEFLRPPLWLWSSSLA